MGAMKHTLPWRNGDLLDHMIEAARPLVEEVVLIGASVRGRGLDCWTDAEGVEGPLGGLITMSRRRPQTHWLALSCDMPLMTTEALEWLISWATSEWSAVIPRTRDAHTQPLAALYAPHSGPLLEAVASGSTMSPRLLVNNADVHSPQVPGHLDRCWTNVNTPEDLERCVRSLNGNLSV